MQVGYSLAVIISRLSNRFTFHRLEKTRSVVVRSSISSTHLHVEVSAMSAVVSHQRYVAYISLYPNQTLSKSISLPCQNCASSGFCTYPVRLSCSPKCLNSVISLKALRARMTLSKTLVIHLTATGSPLSVSCTEITSP